MTSVTPPSGTATTPRLSTAPASTLPTSALASPYDGTVPSSLGAVTPIGAGQIPQLTGLGGGIGADGGPRQVNATNQSAYAPNGNVNQTVTNENSYTNKYYNIIVPNNPYGGFPMGGMPIGGLPVGGYPVQTGGVLGGLGGLLGLGGAGYGASTYPTLGSGYGGYGSWNQPGNSYVDPQTGVMYVQKDTGITGWFKRLFRGW